MTDSPFTVRVLDILQAVATAVAIGVAVGVMIPLVGEFIMFTYLMPEGME